VNLFLEVKNLAEIGALIAAVLGKEFGITVAGANLTFSLETFLFGAGLLLGIAYVYSKAKEYFTKKV
jgi:hypothetical protein